MAKADSVDLSPEESAILREVEAGFVTPPARGISHGMGTPSMPSTPDLDAKGALLKRGMEQGVSLKEPLGQKFAVSKSGGQAPAYKAMSRDDKAAFRKAWCKDCYEEHLCVLRTKSMESSRTKLSTMTMVSGKALIKREGTTAFAMYAKKCQKLGPPWIEWDPMWERFNYADITKEYRDKFEQAWKVVVSDPSEKTEEQPSPAPKAGAKDGVVEAVAPHNSKRKRGNSADGGKPENNKELKGAKASSAMKQAEAAAVKLRAKIQATQGTSRQLQETIKQSPTEWDWANQSKLKAASAALTEFLQSTPTISSFFLLGNSVDFKKQTKSDPGSLRSEFSQFTSKGGPLEQDLSMETQRLLAMQAADKKARADAKVGKA